MLDINYIRKDPEGVEKNAKNKGLKIDFIKLLKLDEDNQILMKKIDALRADINKASKSKPDAVAIKKLRAMGEEIKKLEEEKRGMEEKLRELLWKIPNMVSKDTPVGKDEKDNKVLRIVGEKTGFKFRPKEHWELGEALDVVDFKRASKVSGSRFVYLKNELALMQFAIVQHVFNILTNEKILSQIVKNAKLKVSAKPFIAVVPPVFVKPEVMDRMARLEPKDERYYIKSDNQFLVGSAEHTLGPLHMDEVLQEKDLPLRYIGYSTAFRREAGSYGKDTKGMIRVHQFDKLEMESFSVAEDSILEQDFLVAIQEYLMQSLGLPYRVVQLCTGDMGGPDARQIDIETWMPGQNTYRETHTADLMTDYQARRLKIRVKRRDGNELVHMNDATAIAIGRTLVAIMENYQTKEGTVKVPSVLQKYCGFQEITNC